LTIGGDYLTITSKSVSGEVYDEVEAEIEGGELKIAFNCRFLINTVRAAESDTLRLAFKSATQSMIVTPAEKKDGEDFFYMVVPVRMID
jgi:DNA polymerase III sliding clamp (beta) subunit (PCNA family)